MLTVNNLPAGMAVAYTPLNGMADDRLAGAPTAAG